MTRSTRKVPPEHDPKVTVQRVSSPAPIRRLVVGATHDPAEADADRMAEKALQVAQAWRGGSAEAPVRRSTPVGTPAPLSKSFQIDAQVVDDASGGGQSLPDATRRSMESGFGADFANVRVHAGPVANEVSQSIGARAFTRGSDLFFGAGEYRPGSSEGDHVIAHELAHVVQSGQAGGQADVHRFPMTALSAPVQWPAHKPTVFRPGEGASGGVYILTSTAGDDSVKKVVVKPIFGKTKIGTFERGEQLVFADKALSSLLGISTPKSRVVNRGTPEYRAIVALCLPHYPARKPVDPDSLEVDDWQPLDAAMSFVVMGEVPNASSVSSLADKAAGGGKAAADLHSAVFSQPFLNKLGRMCVGDMLIGNADRINASAVNLGNVMVSMSERGATPWAIDTAAYLDTLNPKQILEDATASSGLVGFTSTKNTFQKTPAKLLEGFYGVIAERMDTATKAGTPKSADNRTPAQIFKDTYTANLPKFVGYFEDGWQEGLIEVNALINTKTGRRKMKALTEEQKGTAAASSLKYDALKVNATYLAAKAEGAEHKEAAEDAANLAARKSLENFTRVEIEPPTDIFHWSVAKPDPAMYAADLENRPPLPRVNDIYKGLIEFPVYERDYRRPILADITQAIIKAKAEADKLGTKKRGIIHKQVVPRNRVVAIRYLADAFAVGAGATRAICYGSRLSKSVSALDMVVSSKMTGSRAAKVLPAAQFISSYVKTYSDMLKSYEATLTTTAVHVRKIKKFNHADGLADSLGTIVKTLGEADAKCLDPIRKKNPTAMYNALKALTAVKR